MYKITNTPDLKTDPKPETDIFSRSIKSKEGANHYTIPGTGAFLQSDFFKALTTWNNGIKEVAVPKGESSSLADAAEDLAAAILLPPSEDYSTIVPPEGENTVKQIDSVTKKQFIQQFYEAYMVPVGTKDIYNRLGSIAGNVADLHALFPGGVKGLIAADAKGSWRANLNFSFTVDEELGTEPFKYSSLAFPPFVSHEALNIKDLSSSVNTVDDIESNALDSTFDMQNVLYKGNAATFRFPAFKQVNDNINLLQVLLNRCFGVESTFINEWDLSMYMQEGLLSYIEKADADGEIIRLPQFVTTLTYGLLDDAPVDDLTKAAAGGSKDKPSVDFDKATPFASVNCAVSTRYGIDNEPIGQQVNTLDYIIADYPYSAYWYPNDDGNNSRLSNVSMFIDDMFAYTEVGETFNEKNPTGHWYTPAIFHGKDLARSTKRFGRILNYTDNRYAILSGWNSTDENGNNYVANGDSTNENARSNTYSYLPFWKQFYTSAEDGMSDVDKYIQEIYAKDSEVSFLNAAYQIINLTTASNEIFQNLISDKMGATLAAEVEEGGDAIESASSQATANKYGGIDYSDMKFSLFKCKLKIPGSKLLKMFLNKISVTRKAMAAADSAGGASLEDPDANVATGAANSASSGLKNATPTKMTGEKTTTVVDGQEVEVSTYEPEDDDELSSKKVVGDGIAEWSPFLYGGPHGKYFSPLTLEGYTQFGNQMLANVPTVDTFNIYNGATISDYPLADRTKDTVRGLEFSKNAKNDGSYIDSVVCLTPNERVTLLSSNQPFGVTGLGPDTKHWSTYYSNPFYRECFWEDTRWIKIRLGFCTIKIPNFWYFKTVRTLNGQYDRWRGFTYDYGTGAYRTHLDDGRWEWDVSVQEDWTSQNFRLIPMCGRTGENGMNDASNIWDSNTTRTYIRHDQDKFRRRTDFYIDDSTGNVIYRYKADRYESQPLNGQRYQGNKDYIGKGYVKYLIAPTSEGAATECRYDERYVWSHYANYSTPGTKWYNQLKNLWYSGTRECTMTLPIVDQSNNVINITCGVANIYRSITYTWVWTLRQTLIHTYRRHGCSWCCPHKVRCYHYVWVLERREIPVYNMFFRPGMVQWSLPTKKLLNAEANYTDQRSKDSSNIIERYCTDGSKDHLAKRFTSIGTAERWSPQLFPFTEQFMDRYGRYEPYLPLPGHSRGPHIRPAGSLKILYTKGLYYGDISESYRTKGYVQTVKKVKPVYETDVWEKTYTDTAAGVRYNVYLKLGKLSINVNWAANIFRFFFGRWYEQKSRFSVRSEFFWTAYYPDWVPDQFGKSTELTNILNDAQNWPTVQEYQIGQTPYMTWYKPKDTIDVYVDTVTQQIAWLKQLKDYANLYLSDSLIYEVYRKGVDARIQAIIKYNKAGDSKNGSDYKSGCGGWTESFTEDINYHDALAIVEKVFNTKDASKNTIYDLVSKRIERLEALKAYAKTLQSEFGNKPDTMFKFVKLVTNTKSYLDCAYNGDTSAESVIFDSTGNYVDGLFEVNSSTTFNLIQNPATVTWAYLNVLYQIRKYWVNVRFNKRAGSYWQLRSLERVLTFLLAENTAEDSVTAEKKHIPQGTVDELKNKSIVFVQTRDSFTNQVESAKETKVTETEAVYVKVNYLGTPTPTKSSKWDEEKQTYNGEEIVYVNETYRWAKKPQDGQYYIMSKAITETISGFINVLKSTVSLIFAKTYKVTSDDVYQVQKLLEYGQVDFTNQNLGDIKTYAEFKTYLDYINIADKTLKEAYKIADAATSLSAQVLNNVVKVFTNTLLTYKKDYYLEQVQKYLFSIYIRWQPQQVWTGMMENDSKGAWHIDEWQKKDSLGKERTVIDLYGYEHKSSEAISAGITFDVSAAIDAGTLLSSPSILKDSTLLEILCSSVDKMDLWRVELPQDIHLPASLLNDKPVLVPAYQIDASLNGLKTGKVSKSTKSVLAGVSTNAVLPILEPTESLLSINTLSALGKFNDIAQTGLSVDSVTSSGN